MALHRVTLVEQLVHTIACGILRGDWEPGSSLPSLRKLASAHGVTLPTAQRAVAQLQTLGLVRAHHGSGVEVLNPAIHAELAALPYWIEALYDRPAEATRVLADFLEVRRDIAAAFVARLTRDQEALPDLSHLKGAIAELQGVAEDDQASPEDVAEADIEVARALIGLRPQTAVASIFGVFERALRGLPELQRSMYAEPEANARGYQALLGLLTSGVAVDAETLSSLLSPLDEATLHNFETELS